MSEALEVLRISMTEALVWYDPEDVLDVLNEVLKENGTGLRPDHVEDYIHDI